MRCRHCDRAIERTTAWPYHKWTHAGGSGPECEGLLDTPFRKVAEPSYVTTRNML